MDVKGARGIEKRWELAATPKRRESLVLQVREARAFLDAIDQLKATGVKEALGKADADFHGEWGYQSVCDYCDALAKLNALLGVDDPAAYAANVDAYLSADLRRAAAQEREAKLKATTDSLQAEIERLKEANKQEAIGLFDKLIAEKADNAKLRGVVAQQASRIERLREALELAELRLVAIRETKGQAWYEFDKADLEEIQTVLAESADMLGGWEVITLVQLKEILSHLAFDIENETNSRNVPEKTFDELRADYSRSRSYSSGYWSRELEPRIKAYLALRSFIAEVANDPRPVVAMMVRKDESADVLGIFPPRNKTEEKAKNEPNVTERE